MKLLTLSAFGALILAIAAWVAFGFLALSLDAERYRYADARIKAMDDSTRGEAAVRLRTTIRESEAERAALEGVFNVTILEAAETIEATGRRAGATSVTIGSATPLSNSSRGLTNVAFVVNARGSFTALMRAVALFEVLPIPSVVERFEISERESGWDLTAHLRTTIAAQNQ